MKSDTKYNTEEAAGYLGCKVRTLENWRNENIGPRYFKPTGKLIYYFQSDLDQWIRSEGGMK